MTPPQPDASRGPIHLVVAIHGILTGRSSPTWPERLQLYLGNRRADTVTLTDHYDAGPFPRTNWFRENPKRARAIAEVVMQWVKAGNVASLTFVAHSNGCDIARRAIIELAKETKVTSAILVSAPLPRTPKKMGLEDAVWSGALGRLILYSASHDTVLAPEAKWSRPWTIAGTIARWPYGNAGRLGMTEGQWLQGEQGVIKQAVATRMFQGLGHGDFFPRDNPVRTMTTFGLIEQDAFTP